MAEKSLADRVEAVAAMLAGHDHRAELEAVARELRGTTADFPDDLEARLAGALADAEAAGKSIEEKKVAWLRAQTYALVLSRPVPLEALELEGDGKAKAGARGRG